MSIELPEQINGTARRFYSLDGTPVLIDFQMAAGELPVSAYRLGTEKGGFVWKELEEDLFLETFRDGKEVDMFDFMDDVVPNFVSIRSPQAGHGRFDFDLMG